MTSLHSIEITTDDGTAVPDAELENLLVSVYVGEGFTDPDVARTIFAASAVRSRGHLVVAKHAGALVGTLILVPPGAPARRVAGPTEGEFHLMAVRPDFRRQGVGKMLMQAAVDLAMQQGLAGIALSTQPTMHDAHRLYESLGFSRAPERDWDFRERTFLAFQRRL